MKLHTHLFLVVCGIALFSCGGQQEAPQSAATAPAAAPTTAPVVEEKPQTKEERIQEVELWYTEMLKQEKVNCETKKRMKYAGGVGGSESYPLKQIVTTCKLDSNLELVKGEFQKDQWGYKIDVCKKDGKIFFVFVEGGGCGESFEKRYYCDRNENLIQLLENSADMGEKIKGKGKQARLDSKKQKVQENIADYLADVNFVMAGK